jgi:methyl-accepting chemotaxis protein
MSLQKKLFLISALPLMIIFLVVTFLTESVVRNSLVSNAESVARNMAATSKAELEAYLGELRTVTTAFADSVALMEALYLEDPYVDRELMLSLFENALYSSKMFSGTLYLAPDAIEMGAPAEEYWVSRIGDEESREYKRDVMTNTESREWFQGAFINKKLTVTNPYVFNTTSLSIVPNPTKADLDKPDNRYVITIAVPIKMKDGRILGVATIDLRAARFDAILENVKPFGTGYAVFMGADGILMSTPVRETINTDYRDLTYIQGVNPGDVVEAVVAGKNFESSWYNTNLNKDMYMVAQPTYVGEGAVPMGLVLAFVMDDALAAVGFDSVLLISRGVLAFIILIIVATTFIMRYSIIRYLKRFMDAMRDLTEGEGDLTKKIVIHTGDEFEVLAGYLNKFVENLCDVITEVKSAAEEVASSNSELSATMEELSTTFNSQSEQVSAVASNMDMISDSSKVMVESLGVNVNMMGDAKDSMGSGSKQLNLAVDNMNMIKDKTKSLGMTVENLKDSSNKIGDILGVINDIADQTNLLALNAAIEAARAGDAGRGFAVVADEVRKLAERTQSSTSEIEIIIRALQDETGNASIEMKGAADSVDEGLAGVLKTDETFTSVVGVVNEMDTNTQGVNHSISEQFNMIQTVTDNAQAIAAGIEESGHAVYEVTKTVSYLQQKTDNLKMLVARFKVE